MTNITDAALAILHEKLNYVGSKPLASSINSVWKPEELNVAGFAKQVLDPAIKTLARRRRRNRIAGEEAVQ